MKLLVVLFICIGLTLAARGGRRRTKPESKPSEKLKAEKDYVASILQLPSVYHSCNAFFVTDSFLVAPATCVLCDEICNFQVAINAVSVFDTAKFIPVKNITMHPRFLDSSSHSNPSYNIALIQLTERVNTIDPLMISKTLQLKEGYIRFWSFNNKMTDFSLKASSFQKVTHYLCDESTAKVKVDEICIHGYYAVELGKFNEGTVFVVDDTESDEGLSYAMGFYARGSSNFAPSRYYSFISLPYYYAWLNETIISLRNKEFPGRIL